MKTIILLLTTLLTICNAISQTVGLDTTFGEGGVVRTNLVEQIKADDIRESIVAVQPDGKLIIAIDFQSVHPKIIRVNQDGSLDRSLKSPVLTIMDLNAMILQDDGKIIVAGKRFSLVDNRDHFAMARLNNDGSFDIGFGKNGKVNTDEGTGGIINAVATQPDKKIVVAGNFGIARFKSDGSFDSSFGLNGKIEINLPYTGPFKEVYDIAVQQDGKIVAVGISSHDNIALARYLNNGSLDSGFSDDGMIDKDYGQNTLANAVAIQKNGKIVIAGISNESYLSDFLLVRYNVDGSPDPEFNGGDPIIKDVAGFADYARDLFIQEDGKVVTGGNCLVPIQYGNKNSEIALARYNVNGTPDSSFDRDGILIDSIPLDDENIFSLALQSDGKIIACGYARVTVDQNCLITRYNSEGSRDTSFDGDGKITPYITSLEDNATAMVIQGDGKILVSGDINNTSAALVRYMPDGNLDSGFGNNGKVYSLAAWEPSDFTTAIALQNDGKIVVAGASEYDFALWRYNADGSPDPDFGNNGKTITTLSANTDIANAIAVQKDGKILCAGYAYFNTKSFFAMVRYTSTGNIDNSFGDNGIVLTSFDSLYVSRANAMFIQDDGRIILAGKNGDNFALARYNENGTLDLSFDGDGLQTTKYGNSECHFTALALQSDGKIIASGSTGDEGRNPSDFAIARYNTDGSLDSSFGMNGLVTINFGTAYNHSYANATQPDGKILVAGTSGLATDFAFARYNTDGSPDNSFNGNGRLLLSFWENFDGSGLAEDARAIALYNDHIYIAGSAVDDYVLIRLKNNIALSLEFLEFTAAWHNDNDVLLQWVTANEVNTLSFDIEQSTDGINFALIGNVASANSPGEHQYSFVVPNTSLLSATRFYYRLKQKDRDGHFTYSKIVNLSTENQRKVMIYPNPVISEFTLTASADLPESINLRMIDNGGRILQRQQWLVSPGSNSLVINVRGLAKGIYYLQMEGKTIRKNLKFINQ